MNRAPSSALLSLMGTALLRYFYSIGHHYYVGNIKHSATSFTGQTEKTLPGQKKTPPGAYVLPVGAEL